MSSVSSTGGLGDLQQLFARLKSSGGTGTSVKGFPSGAPPKPSQEQQTQFTSALKSQGLSDDQISSLQSQLQSAVSKGASGGDGNSDPFSAIQGVLKKNGVDTDKLNKSLGQNGFPGGQPPFLSGGSGGISGSGQGGGSSNIQNLLDAFNTNSSDSGKGWLVDQAA